MTTGYNYECSYCQLKFKTETRFLKHKCKQMIRDEELRSILGQSAWRYYQSWMKAHRRMVPKERAFLKSRYFSAFLKFAKFVKNTHIPDTDAYIWLMKEKNISPTIWTSNEAYVMFLEFMDRKISPKRHAEITINTLFDEADEREVDISDIFDNITPIELMQLMSRRQVSPWFLLNSKKFKAFFINKTTADEKIRMESIIRPAYWKKKFAENPTAITHMKLYVKELNL